jgi:plasmid maintenance system antidote protein VapI
MTTGWAPTVEQLEPAKDANALTEVRSLLERMVMAYSPATVAGILGVDKSAVSHWLNGKRAISPPMRVRVIEAHDLLSRVH